MLIEPTRRSSYVAIGRHNRRFFGAGRCSTFCDQAIGRFGCPGHQSGTAGVGDFARNYDKTVKGMASHFVWINRSKESLALDLKQEEAKEVLYKLLEEADVFLHNLAPGAVDRLGFSAEELRQNIRS